MQHLRDRCSIHNSWNWFTGILLRENAHRHRNRNGLLVLEGYERWRSTSCASTDSASIADPPGAVSHNVELLLRLMRWDGQGGPQPASTRDF